MKRTIPIIAAIAVAAGLTVAAAHEHRMGPPPPPHGLMPQIERALSSLDLTGAQKETIEQKFQARRSAMEARHDQAMQAHMALRSAIIAEPFDEGSIRNAAAAVGSLLADLSVADAALLRDIRAELSEDQRDRLNEILSRPPLPPDGAQHRSRHHGGTPND